MVPIDPRKAPLFAFAALLALCALGGTLVVLAWAIFLWCTERIPLQHTIKSMWGLGIGFAAVVFVMSVALEQYDLLHR